MRQNRIRWLLLVGLLLLAPVTVFNRFFLRFASNLPGDSNQGALALWHLWWPPFGFQQPDGLTIHAFNGTPFLENHLLAMPILQSYVYRIFALTQNPILAFNLTLLATVIATLIGVFLFLRSKQISDVLAALGAFALVASAWYAGQIDQANLIGASLWALPLALLAWDAWLARPSLWRAALVVIALYAGILSGVQALGWITALWLPYAVWTGQRLWRRMPGEESRRRLTESERDGLALITLLFIILFFIYPGPVIVRTLQGNEAAFAAALPALPPDLRSLLGEVRSSSPAIWLAAIAALFLARPDRKAIFWLALGGVLFLMGTFLLPDPLRMIAGALALPYQPFYPTSLFLGLSLFALIVFACRAWNDVWVQSLAGRFELPAAAGIALIVVAANYPMLRGPESTPVPVYPFYASIAPEPEDYLLLEYPFGIQNMSLTGSPDESSLGDAAYLSRYGVWHQKRNFGGVLPYAEPAVFDRYREMSFLFPEMIDDASFDDAAAQLSEAVRTWRIGYVVVHADLLNGRQRDRIAQLAEASGALCPSIDRDGLTVYRALWHPYGCE